MKPVSLRPARSAVAAGLLVAVTAGASGCATFYGDKNGTDTRRQPLQKAVITTVTPSGVPSVNGTVPLVTSSASPKSGGGDNANGG